MGWSCSDSDGFEFRPKELAVLGEGDGGLDAFLGMDAVTFGYGPEPAEVVVVVADGDFGSAKVIGFDGAFVGFDGDMAEFVIQEGEVLGFRGGGPPVMVDEDFHVTHAFGAVFEGDDLGEAQSADAVMFDGIAEQFAGLGITIAVGEDEVDADCAVPEVGEAIEFGDEIASHGGDFGRATGVGAHRVS